MGVMDVRFEIVTEEAQYTMECGCGRCHPTATFYRGDPRYECHDARLAEGPCCCGRFFVLGETMEAARHVAEKMVTRGLGEGGLSGAYDFKEQTVALPWGGSIVAIAASPRESKRP